MGFPKRIKEIEPIELKLGIKSSYKKLKPSLAFLYLLWKSSEKKHSYIYATQEETATTIFLNIKDEYFISISSLLHQHNILFDKKELRESINKIELFTNQIEPIKVALELIWRIAKIEFVDSNLNYSVERTKQNGKLCRFSKKISFTKNIDLIEQISSLLGNDAINVFYSWLMETPVKNSNTEKQIISAFTFISEEAMFRIKTEKDGDSLIFNQAGIYEVASTGEEVNINDVNENKGSSRILKNLISEGLNRYLFSQKQTVNKKGEFSDESLFEYAKRINSFLDLTQIELKEVYNNILTYEEDIVDEFNQKLITDDNRVIGAINKIFYGAPGTGKSYEVTQQYPNFKHVTFHPEYTYFDFIGGLRPVQDDYTGKISYEFVSGPFTDALIEALLDNKNHHGLIIEEINRANTAAVFGDIFQLLDRNEDGQSEYKIVNKDLQKYIEKVFEVHFEEIYLPSNFSLIATMNSADQGVYVMDSAFKRRWQFEYVPIVFDSLDFKDVKIAGFNILWKDFGKKLNIHLTNIGVEEDKLIGQRFISISDMNNSDKVASKLLIYLWDDVVRYKRKELFREVKTFSNLITSYKKIGVKIFVPALAEELENHLKDTSTTYLIDDIKENLPKVAEEDVSNYD